MGPRRDPGVAEVRSIDYRTQPDGDERKPHEIRLT
jgi:hypothetical protein